MSDCKLNCPVRLSLSDEIGALKRKAEVHHREARSVRNQRNKLHRQLKDLGIEPCVDLNDAERDVAKQKYHSRNTRIWLAIEEGATPKSVAKRFGLSTARIGQIYRQETYKRSTRK